MVGELCQNYCVFVFVFSVAVFDGFSLTPFADVENIDAVGIPE